MKIVLNILISITAIIGLLSIVFLTRTMSTVVVVGTVLLIFVFGKLGGKTVVKMRNTNAKNESSSNPRKKKWYIALRWCGIGFIGLGIVTNNISVSNVLPTLVLMTLGVTSLTIVGCCFLYERISFWTGRIGQVNEVTSRQSTNGVRSGSTPKS